jgi:hypothetical protein
MQAVGCTSCSKDDCFGSQCTYSKYLKCCEGVGPFVEVDRKMSENTQELQLPLGVDCDGTLIKTDLLFEAFCALLKQSPGTIFLLPFWLLKGKAYLKQCLAKRVDLDITLLPYNTQVLNFLLQEKAKGRKLVLVTASPRKFAQQIADHLDLFCMVIATDGDKNICGKHKAESLVTAFGEQAFEYAANG